MSNIDLEDEKKPFQLRAFPVATRKLATDCANRAGFTLPEWMDHAVHSQARIDAQESVFPPGTGPATEPQPASTRLGELIALITAAALLAQHTKLPGEVRALINQRAREAQGLPPRHAMRLHQLAAE